MEITLNDKIYNVTPEDYSIESIIVFGSFIRGDNNIHSDIDFLIVIDNCSYNEKLITKLNIAEEMQIHGYQFILPMKFMIYAYMAIVFSGVSS